MGGSRPSQPTFINPPPAQIQQAPPPNIQQNASDLFKAQLEYNPQLTSQAVNLQQQYGLPLAQAQANVQTQLAPQLAQSEYNIANQFTPLYRSLYERTFPTQTQNLQMLAEQAGQRLASPQGLTPQQQAAQDAIRGRARDQVTRSVRESANIGGTLYGGHRQEREDRAVGELEQGFAAQDIGLMDQRRQQALQEMIAAGQVVFPQVQQPGISAPGVPQYGSSVTPSSDSLLQAIMQGQIVQPAVYQQGSPGRPSWLGSFARAF